MVLRGRIRETRAIVISDSRKVAIEQQSNSRFILKARMTEFAEVLKVEYK
jgi:hypothetical protein